MKKYLFIFPAIVLATLCGCSKWAGDPITQEFSIDGTYTELQVEDAFDVYVSNEVSQITVTAGDNIMPKVKVEKNGDKLEIYLKGWSTSYGSDMKVLLPANPNLQKVNLSGASDFYGDLAADNVEIVLSGSSDIEGSVAATNLSITLSGSSDATLEGQVGKLILALSGSSDLEKKMVGNHYALSCDECEGTISGSSEAYIHCDGNIKVKVSGSSSLHYTGYATTTGSSTSGSSDIEHDAF
ncbi:MAG: DUF2807 domain-containing protein [Bacteroidales bacterium]|nr:DUF2807 domain-containing protein [Bacteroidales bacterium]